MSVLAAGLLVAAVAVVPAASAAESGTAPVGIRMATTHGAVTIPSGGWISRGMFGFLVEFTDIGAENEQGLTVFLSVPPEVDLNYWGERWECWDTDGGIDCYHPDLVVPGEAWPTLYIDARPEQKWIQDSIDVYVTTADFEPTHKGVYYLNDTSL